MPDASTICVPGLLTWEGYLSLPISDIYALVKRLQPTSDGQVDCRDLRQASELTSVLAGICHNSVDGQHEQANVLLWL